MSLVNNEIPRMLLTKIEESNASIGQQQMDNISSTLTLIKNPRQEKMERMRISSIQRCVVWCQKHNLPYNRDVRHFNMFLSAKNKVSRIPRKKHPEQSTEQDDITNMEDTKCGCSLPTDSDVSCDVGGSNSEDDVKALCERIVNSLVDDAYSQ